MIFSTQGTIKDHLSHREKKYLVPREAEEISLFVDMSEWVWGVALSCRYVSVYYLSVQLSETLKCLHTHLTAERQALAIYQCSQCQREQVIGVITPHLSTYSLSSSSFHLSLIASHKYEFSYDN